MSVRIRSRNRVAIPSLPVLRARLLAATTTIAAIAVVGIAIVLAVWINARAGDAAGQVSHSIEMRERAERFLGHMRDAETGQRGYLLTGDLAYLAPFLSGRAAALPELDVLERLAGDDAAQAGRIAQLRTEARRKLGELDLTVALMRDGKRAEAMVKVNDGLGAVAMSALREITQDIQLAENLRLVALNRREDGRRLMASAGIVVALAGLAFAAWAQLRQRQLRMRDPGDVERASRTARGRSHAGARERTHAGRSAAAGRQSPRRQQPCHGLGAAERAEPADQGSGP